MHCIWDAGTKTPPCASRLNVIGTRRDQGRVTQARGYSSSRIAECHSSVGCRRLVLFQTSHRLSISHTGTVLGELESESGV